VYWLDTAILAVVATGAVFGALSGLLWQVARVVGFAAAVYASIYLNDWAARTLQEVVLDGADARLAMVLAYLLVFLAIYLTFFCLTVVLERAMKAVRLQPLNRLFGAGLGAVKAGLLLGALFLGMASYPHPSTREMLDRSLLAPRLAQGAQALLVAVPQEYKDWLADGVQSLRDITRTGVPSAAKDGKEDR
jgi:uncharacterized membrane protein required for colicin V production